MVKVILEAFEDGTKPPILLISVTPDRGHDGGRGAEGLRGNLPRRFAFVTPGMC